MERRERRVKCEVFRDSMQNYKKYAVPPAQLIIADVPYNIGNNFYGSSPVWYVGGDNANGESAVAHRAAFNSDYNFNLYEYFHFCSRMLKKEDARKAARGRSAYGFEIDRNFYERAKNEMLNLDKMKVTGTAEGQMTLADVFGEAE